MWKGIVNWIVSNPLSVFTAMLAAATVLSVLVSNRSSKRHAIATSESDIMPKIEPAFKRNPNDTGVVILFTFWGNPPQNPEITLKSGLGEELTITPHDHLKYATEFLEARQLPVEPKWTVWINNEQIIPFFDQQGTRASGEVTIQFDSFSRATYRFTYCLDFVWDEKDLTKLTHEHDPKLGISEYYLINRELPWDNVGYF